jgi:hypothetical protein
MRMDATTSLSFSASAPQLVFERRYYVDQRVATRGHL